MSDWVSLPLRDRTVNLDRLRVPVTTKDRISGPYPYYGASGVVDHVDRYIFDGLHLLVAEDGENLRSRKTPIAFLADGQFWVNNHAHVVRANPDNDLHFLAYALEACDLSPFITGSTQPKLSQAALNQIPIYAPSLEGQRSIAAVLRSLDEKLASNARVVAKTLELLDALSLQFVAQLDTVPLRDLVRVETKSVNPSRLGDQLVDHFSLPAFDLRGRPERIAASAIMSNKQRLTGTTLLLSKLNPRVNRTWWAVPHKGFEALASTEFVAMTSDDEIELAAVWLAIRHERFVDELSMRVTGTSGSHQRVRPDDMLSIEVADVRGIRPPVKADIAALLELVEARRSESNQLRILRDALIPELLSGRIRVAVEAVG